MTTTQEQATDLIDNTLIREAAEEVAAEIGWNEIAKRLGWLRKGGGKQGSKDRKRASNQGETSALKRRLGLATEQGMPLSKRIRYDIAVDICRAIGRDPVDVDL